MNTYNAFLPYRDRFGMNQLSTNGTEGGVTQNGALFTFEYLIVLLEDPNTPQSIKDAEVARLRKVYNSLELIPGLARRAPNSTEGNSMDNNGPHLAFSAMFDDGKFAKRMKEHGENVICTGRLNGEGHEKYYVPASLVTILFTVLFRPWLWPRFISNGFRPLNYWNNTEPEKFALWGWYGRSPGFLGNMDLCAQGFTSPFRWLGVLVGQFLGLKTDRGDTDAKKLPYIHWYFLTKKTGWHERWFWKLAYKVWTYFLLKQYPDGMREVYSIYYGDPNHPIRTLSKKHF